MLQKIKEDYNNTIYQAALQRFGIAEDKTRELKGFESFVYECEKEGQELILKITHTLRRTTDYIMGELEFVNYLADNGVATSRTLPSLNNQLVESIEIENGHCFLAYVFEKAPGTLIKKEHWNSKIFFELGKVTGRMHRLTKDYQPSQKTYTRINWDEESYYDKDKYLSGEEDVLIRKQLEKWMGEIKAISTHKNNFGLCHCDLHQGNFFYKSRWKSNTL